MKLNPCKNVPAAQMGPAVTRQLLAYCEAAPAHSHPHLQVVYMIKGKGVFLCGEEEQMIQAGDTVQIDANVPHTFTSIEEDAEWLEFFTPVREDFLP